MAAKLPATSCHKPRKPSILKTNHTRLKMMPTKSFVLQTNCRISYFIKPHGVFKINFQVNKHHRLNTSRTTRSTQHSRQKIINTSRDLFETSYRPSHKCTHNAEKCIYNQKNASVTCLRNPSISYQTNSMVTFSTEHRPLVNHLDTHQ